MYVFDARTGAHRKPNVGGGLIQALAYSARGAAYAGLLATCAPCHEAVGVER